MKCSRFILQFVLKFPPWARHHFFLPLSVKRPRERECDAMPAMKRIEK